MYRAAGFIVGGVLLLTGGLLRGRAEALHNNVRAHDRGGK